MDSIKIILPFPPSSNNAYPTVNRGGKPIRVKSERMHKWEKKLPRLSERIRTKCTVSYLLFVPDARVRDGQSYQKLPLDYLVSEGVIEKDDMRYVIGEQWFFGGIDRENPRVEITIREYHGKL